MMAGAERRTMRQGLTDPAGRTGISLSRGLPSLTPRVTVIIRRAPALLALGVWLIQVGASAATEVNEICRREHPSDTAMHEECVERQNRAIDNIGKFVAKHSLDSGNYMDRYDKGDPAAVIFVNCLLEWPESYLMQEHCINREWETEKKYNRIR